MGNILKNELEVSDISYLILLNIQGHLFKRDRKSDSKTLQRLEILHVLTLSILNDHN